MILVAIVPRDSTNRQTNLAMFSTAITVEGISRLFHTLSLRQDTFHTGVGCMTMSFGMVNPNLATLFTSNPTLIRTDV